MRSGRSRLAAIVTLAYTLVIVYASLQPFTGWRMPAGEVFEYLGAPWPKHILIGDVVFNVIAYLPLGLMLAIALRARLTSVAAFIVTVSSAALLSVAMESTQMFLPTRIASNLDLITNVLGATLGAILI